MSRPNYCRDCTYFWPDDSDNKNGTGTCAQHHKKVSGSDSSCSQAED